MNVANPAGLWALGALAVVLAIHLLQRRPARLVVTTLFLLDHRAPRSAAGRRLDRLRSSASLWLQLAAVAVATWLLMEPLRVVPESWQRTVVLLDSSVSMEAFRDRWRPALERRLAALESTAARCEWIVTETALDRGTLYGGADRGAALAAVRGWTPRLGTHDLGPAFEAARALAGAAGHVVFLTDHVTEVPEGVERLAVGRPLDNVGFVGADVSAGSPPRWRAWVRNHGRTPATRGIEGAAEGSVTLAPGEIRALSGTFSTGEDRADLRLEADAFTVDDRLPLVVPAPKPLTAVLELDGEAAGPFERFLSTVDGLRRVARGTPADLTITRSATAGAGAAVEIGPSPVSGRSRGPAVSDNHPLVEGLVWPGLRVGGPGLDVGEHDRILVWQGGRAVVTLREGRRLRFAFDPGADISRLPAFPLLLHRFVESVRDGVVALERRNVETNEALSLAVGTAPAVAPPRPDFFTVREGDTLLLDGAAHFADAREADFTTAASLDDGAHHDRRLLERHARPDPALPLWAALLAGLVLADGWLAGRTMER